MRKLICLLLCLSLFAAPAFAETTAKPASLEERFSDFWCRTGSTAPV